ncbi:MAG: hypothetical protein HUJ26_09375 [Planctomycetaceae bacterium]|nr:hypothetical protein [Planctomycetaceae bacterium]
MNSGFAGSASNDDRRRRRLLSEHNEDGVDGAIALAMSREISESTRNHRYPLKRLLHYKVWRLWLIAVAMTFILSGFLYGAWMVEQNQEHPAIEMLFSLQDGRLLPALTAGLLLLMGQMSWLIGWARSRSPVDFSGRYRVWTPIGLFFWCCSLSIILRADEILNQSLEHAGVTMPWRVAEWNWMLPLAGVGVILLGIMNGELRSSRIARLHLWLGVLGLTAGMTLPYFPQVQLPQLAVTGLTLGGLMLICQSLLWFGRHVLYVSADPVKRQPSMIWKVLKSFFQSDPERAAKKEADREARKEKAQQQREQKEKAKADKSRRRGRKKKAPKTSSKKPVAKETGKEEQQQPEKTVEKPAQAEKTVTEKPRIRLRAEDITVSSVDVDVLQERLDMMELLAEEGEPFDQDLLKGLTKKQKKQIRSAWRDLEREYETRRAG